MTLENLSALFRDEDRFILSSHESPDADGLGAAYALCRALRSLGKKTTAVISEPLSERFQFLDPSGIFRTVGDIESPGPDAFSAQDVRNSLLIVLDTNDVHYAGRVADVLLDRVRGHLLIDHHELRGSEARNHLLDPGASSTCEIAYDVIRNLGAEIDLNMANALYAGIVYDTGS